MTVARDVVQQTETAEVVDLVVAARMLGIGRTLAYRLVQEGKWPTPIIRFGRLIKIPVAPLREFIRDPHATR